MVVVAGFAVTEAPVVALKPVAGDQVYDVAPLAVNVVELPAQIAGEAGVTVNTDAGSTVMVMLAVDVPQVLIPVTV